MFADDVKLFLKISCKHNFITLQNYLIKLNEWCDLIALSFSLSKYTVI